MTARVAAERRRNGCNRWIVLMLGVGALVPTVTFAGAWPALPPEVWTEKARPDSGGRDAIILSAEGTAEDRGSSFRIEVSRRLRIFTEKGRDAGKIEIDFRKGGSKLTEIAARSVRQDGTTTELAPDQVLTTTILKSGGREYSRVTAIVPGIEPGCIVEYRYKQEGKYDGLWVWPWSFQNEYYTLESRFRWHAQKDVGVRPRWVYHKIPEFMVARTCTPDCDDVKEVTFATRGIPGASNEAWAPPLGDAGASVVTFYASPSASPIQFWSFWKRFLDEVATGFAKDMGTFARAVDDARAANPQPEAALDEISRWLRAHVRSTAELSWEELQGTSRQTSFWGKEDSVADMIRRGEGSPYEINLAFAAAAQRLGYDACVCLVRDRREGVFDYDVIGALPTEPITAVRPKGKTRWRYFQPASRFALPGNIPWYLRGGPGLVAGPGDNLTLTIDPEDGMPGDALWKLDLALDTAGNLKGRFTGTVRGEQARSYRSWLYTEDPARRAQLLAEDLAPNQTPKLELAGVDLDASADSAFVIQGTASYPLLAAASGAVSTLPVEKLVPWRFEGEFNGTKRTQPIFFRYPRRETVTVDLHLPAGAKIDELPAPGSFNGNLGSWQTMWSRIPDGVRYERVVDCAVGQVAARHYDDVQDFFRGLSETDHDLLLVTAP